MLWSTWMSYEVTSKSLKAFIKVKKRLRGGGGETHLIYTFLNFFFTSSFASHYYQWHKKMWDEEALSCLLVSTFCLESNRDHFFQRWMPSKCQINFRLLTKNGCWLEMRMKKKLENTNLMPLFFSANSKTISSIQKWGPF